MVTNEQLAFEQLCDTRICQLDGFAELYKRLQKGEPVTDRMWGDAARAEWDIALEETEDEAATINRESAEARADYYRTQAADHSERVADYNEFMNTARGYNID